MLKDAEVIYRWEKAIELAHTLGMTIDTNTETLFVRRKGKIFHCSETIEGVRGYLMGYVTGKG